MNGILYLEDGTVYRGKGFGKKGTSVGELVFNTSITGYQEILTDPSYSGQIITMTYPIIGSYGVNDIEKESGRIYAKGFVVRSINNKPSNYMSEGCLESMLKAMEVVGISDVDTRSITKKIRNNGSLKCVISSEDLSIPELENYLKKAEVREDWMMEAGVENIENIPGQGPKVALLDFGVKGSIVSQLKEKGCDITIFPYNSSLEDIMSINPDGLLLSNGPGNPKAAVEAIDLVKNIMSKLPVFGICLGHQILALAMEADTYKMKYGHRGGNHGVYDIEKDRAYITSQNHGYAVAGDNLEQKGMIVTHVNLNDNTIEGMKHKELPVFSVQFHPEGAPGPTDSTYLFDKFIGSMKGDAKWL